MDTQSLTPEETAHWLREFGGGDNALALKYAALADEGRAWGQVTETHSDGSFATVRVESIAHLHEPRKD